MNYADETLWGLKFLRPKAFVEDTYFPKCNILIGKETFIGEKTVIHRNTIIRNNTTIGNECIIGNNCLIRDNVKIGHRCKIGFSNAIEPFAEIGNNTSTQGFCMISEHSKIGNDVFLGPYFNNPADNSIGKPEGTYVPKPSEIKDNVRIGSHVVITPENTIKEHTIIGAGSVVTDSTDAYSLYYGCPAKKRNVK